MAVTKQPKTAVFQQGANDKAHNFVINFPSKLLCISHLYRIKNKILKGTYTLYKYYQLIVYMFSMV